MEVAQSEVASSSKLKAYNNFSSGLGLAYRALVRTGLEYFSVLIRQLHQPQVGFFDRPVGIGERRCVVRYPLQKHLLILDRGGGIGSADHVEARGNGAVGTPLGLAGVVGWQHQKIAGPRLPHTLQALPEQLGPRRGLPREIGPPN